MNNIKDKIIIILTSDSNIMTATIDILFDNILKLDDLQELSHQVICDYFGIQNKENMYIIYGIYRTLIIVKGVSKQLIENCYLTNRLDELTLSTGTSFL